MSINSNTRFFFFFFKGFRLNGSEHRKIANSYRVQKTSFLPEEETEKVEEATFETSPIQEADVEVPNKYFFLYKIFICGSVFKRELFLTSKTPQNKTKQTNKNTKNRSFCSKVEQNLLLFLII